MPGTTPPSPLHLVERSGYSHKEVDRLLPAFVDLCSFAETIDQIVSEISELSVTQNNVKDDELREELMISCVGRLHDLLDATREKLAGMAYPFEHTQDEVSVAGYLVEEVTELLDHQGIVEQSHTVVERYYDLHYRLFGRLALCAEVAEFLIALEPLKGVTWDPQTEG